MAITGEIISNIQGNIYGYGASQLLPILAYHLDNDFSQFKYIFDDDANKYNLTYSNLSVDILKTDFNIIDSESTIVITAVDSVKSLLPTLTKSFSGKIIYPLPIM